MHHTDDPGQMTADQRLHEIAAILARGVLRWQKSAADSGNRQNPAKSATAGLEVSGETRLSVSRVSEVNRTTNQRGIR